MEQNNQEVIDEIETDVETEEVDTEEVELTVEDYKKLEERLKKAESRLVEYKKKEKSTKSEEKPTGDYITKEDLLLEKFIDKNPELEDYKDDFLKYVKRGNNYEEAKLLVLNSDKAIENKKKINSMNITYSDTSPKRSEFTQDEVAKLPQNEAAKLWEMAYAGKIRIK